MAIVDFTIQPVTLIDPVFSTVIRICEILNDPQDKFLRAFHCSASAIWKSLPNNVTAADSLASFKFRVVLHT